MPPRKSLTSAPKRPRESESVTETVTSNTPTSDKTSKKRKIDWATIDDAKPFPGFTLHAPKAKAPKKSGNKRQKTRKSVDGGPNVSYKDAPLDANGVQQNPFEDGTLSEIHYLVKPTAEWESTLRYRKFTINESEFEVGQTIFVSKTEEAQDAESVIQHWIGKVLEVRAGDAAHVYLRVYWLYRPEDLPEGRQPYHAESELIASNHMDVIEALSVIDKATVIHWDEDIDKPWPLKDQLFWRQTYDVGKLKSRRLSSLRKVCVDQAPCNPDEGLVQCPSCSEWLHAHCLEDRAAKDAQAKNVTSTKKRNGAPESSAGVEFRARFTTLGESGPTYLTIEDMRPDHDHKRWNVDIKCLMCDQLIEQAAGDLPPEAALAAESVTLHSRQAIETEEEQNSVIDKEEDKGNIANPGSATIAPAKRGRGRPRKSDAPSDVAVQRGRGQPRKVPPGSPTNTTVEVVKREDEQPKKRKRSTNVVEAITDVPAPTKKIAEQKAKHTPISAPVNESVFQSGFRSVKKLLWMLDAA